MRFLLTSVMLAALFIPMEANLCAEEPAIANHPDWPLLRRIEAKADFDFQDTTLDSAISELNQKHNLNLRLDWFATKQAGIDEELRVSFCKDDIRIRDGLFHLLSRYDLRITPDDSWLLVTTTEAAEENLSVGNYPVADLLRSTPDEDPDSDPLVDLVQCSVRPETWEDVGGMGSVCCVNGILTFSQTIEVHRRVAKLLDTLRTLPSAGQAGEKLLPVSVPIAVEDEWHDVLRKKLDVDAKFDEDRIALKHFITDVEDEFEVPIVLNLAAMELDDIPASIELQAISSGGKLGESLRAILEPYRLAFSLVQGCVQITTLVDCDMELGTRLYPIVDLQGGTNPNRFDFDTIINVITTTVAPETWEGVGGTGSIYGFANRGCLVISQTTNIQNEVESFLSDYRRKIQSQNALKPKTTIPKDDDTVTHIYQIPGEKQSLAKMESSLIAELLRNEVEPDSWKHADVKLIPLPERLLIKQRHDVQQEIQKFLDELGLHIKNPYGRIFFGGGSTGSPVFAGDLKKEEAK